MALNFLFENFDNFLFWNQAKSFIIKTETFILASSCFTFWWISFENQPTRYQKLQEIEKQDFKTQKINQEKNYKP